MTTTMNRAGEAIGRVPLNASQGRVPLGRRMAAPEGYTKLPTTPKPVYKCKECQKSFDTDKALKGHQLSHLKKKKEEQ
jgi:hypothetical protein